MDLARLLCLQSSVGFSYPVNRDVLGSMNFIAPPLHTLSGAASYPSLIALQNIIPPPSVALVHSQYDPSALSASSICPLLTNDFAMTAGHLPLANAATMACFPDLDVTACRLPPVELARLLVQQQQHYLDFRRLLEPTIISNNNSTVYNESNILANSIPSLLVAQPETTSLIRQSLRTDAGVQRSSNIDSDIGLLLACPEDRGMLNDHLQFLRQQIEFYRATADDIMCYARGRNKGVALGQVGIRCRHCRHVPVHQRRKGSTYFPSTLMGIYQAAQNLSVQHLQSGKCQELPRDVQNQLFTTAATKKAASGAGKAYWAESAKMQGLVDTPDGIRFAIDVAIGAAAISASLRQPANNFLFR